MDPTHPGSPFQVLPSVNSLDPHRQVGTITTLLLQRWELKHRGEQTTAQGHMAELGHEASSLPSLNQWAGVGGWGLPRAQAPSQAAVWVQVLALLLTSCEISVQHLSFFICKVGWKYGSHSMVERLIQQSPWHTAWYAVSAQ